MARYIVQFTDLNRREHALSTDDRVTAHVAAAQLSMQFGLATVKIVVPGMTRVEVIKFEQGEMVLTKEGG